VIFTNSDSGEQLGEDLLYFMMTGLTTPQLLVVGIALAVIFLFGVGFLIWFAIRKWRRRGGTGAPS
jgi:threonine/homoserine/homoserine lactone efflux protein